MKSLFAAGLAVFAISVVAQADCTKKCINKFEAEINETVLICIDLSLPSEPYAYKDTKSSRLVYDLREPSDSAQLDSDVNEALSQGNKFNCAS